MKNSTCARSAGVTGAPPLIPSQTPVLRPGRVLVFSTAGALVVLTVFTPLHSTPVHHPTYSEVNQPFFQFVKVRPKLLSGKRIFLRLLEPKGVFSIFLLL